MSFIKTPQEKFFQALLDSNESKLMKLLEKHKGTPYFFSTLVNYQKEKIHTFMGFFLGKDHGVSLRILNHFQKLGFKVPFDSYTPSVHGISIPSIESYIRFNDVSEIPLSKKKHHDFQEIYLDTEKYFYLQMNALNFLITYNSVDNSLQPIFEQLIKELKKNSDYPTNTFTLVQRQIFIDSMLKISTVNLYFEQYIFEILYLKSEGETSNYVINNWLNFLRHVTEQTDNEYVVKVIQKALTQKTFKNFLQAQFENKTVFKKLRPVIPEHVFYFEKSDNVETNDDLTKENDKGIPRKRTISLKITESID